METLQEQAVNVGEQRRATGQSETVSQRKLNANRENAKKSTGPRTARGKAYSRKNAIKHGLFARQLWDFVKLGESGAEYDRLLEDLYKQFDPIGRAEELEVERMTVCWWKLQRAYRYENSVNQISVHRAAGDLEQEERSCKVRDKELEAIILGLRNMIHELYAASEVPPDLKSRYFVLTSAKEENWQRQEELAQDFLKKRESSDSDEASFLPNPETRKKILAIHTLEFAIAGYELQRQLSTPHDMKVALGQHVIPNRDDLEKILRYDTAIERSLDRAHNRLERLQRRRKGEPVLPPVNVQLAVGSLVPTKPRPATEENEFAQDEEEVEVKGDPDRRGYIELS